MMEGEQSQSTFNMSLATLERINQILIVISTYAVNHNWLGMKNNLLELYKEVRPFLYNDKKNEKKTDTKDLKEAKEKWEMITPLKCSFEEWGALIYDDKLPELLHDFDFYLRDILYNKGLLMHKGEDASNVL